MKTDLYIIDTLSNLHMGAGDINFDVIDNQVQRDPITTLPNINSSSLKGAFREAFTTYETDENNNLVKAKDTNMVKYIFGGSNDEDSHATGAYSFFEAQLLSRPVRSNAKPFFIASTPQIIDSFLQTIEDFEIEFDTELKTELEKFAKLQPKVNTPLIFEDSKNVILEDFTAQYNPFDISKLQKFLGHDIALFNDADFKELALPVLARNYLENGVSKNLWYEEVVPKKTKFFFCIAKPTNLNEKDKQEKINGFENRFHHEGSKIQFGANKSIGYGFTKVTKVSK